MPKLNECQLSHACNRTIGYNPLRSGRVNSSAIKKSDFSAVPIPRKRFNVGLFKLLI